MAILPTKASLPQAQGFNSGRMIATSDSGGLARGVESLGQSLQSIGADVQQRQDTVDIARAEAAKSQGLIDVKNQFTDDGDYSTFTKRAPVATSDVVTKAADLIRNPAMREKWKLGAGTDAARMNDAIGDKARGLGEQAEKVALDDSMETQRRIYVDPNSTDEERAKAKADIQGTISTALGTGLLTPDEANARKTTYIDNANFSRAKLHADVNPGEVESWNPNRNDPVSDVLAAGGNPPNGGTIPGAAQAKSFLQSRTDKGPEAIQGMQDGFASKLANMFQNAPPEIAAGLGVYSGYRTPEHQAELWKAALVKYGSPEEARKWVAPPGNSEHNKGDAADLGYNGKSLKDAPQNVVDWLHSNADQYGLKFPLGNENWHIEDASTRGGAKGAPGTQVASTAPDWFNQLSPEERQVAYQQAQTKQKQNQVEAQGGIETVVQNAPAAIQNTGGYDGQTPTHQQFIDAYGPQKGDEKFNNFTASLDVAQSSFNFRTMSASDIQQAVEAAKPTSSGNDADLETKKYDALSTAATQTLAARKADPAAYARQAFPSVDQAWNDAGTSGNYQAAMTASAVAQQHLGIQDMKLLPDSIAKQAVSTFKQPDLSDDQRLGAVSSLVFSTPDPKQRQAVFNQMVDAGLPALTEGAMEAASRGDTGAANRLLQAAVTDPEKLPKSGDVKPGDIDSAIYSSVWEPGAIGDATYGVAYGDSSGLERAQRGTDLMKKAVQLRMSQGENLDTAVTGATKDLFGDMKVYNGARGVSANLPVPTDTDTAALTSGLDASKTAFKAALDMQRDRILNTAKPAAGPTGNFAGMLQPGNIDLAKRPVVNNDDGTISTVRSMSFDEDGKEILVPTVSPDGKILSEQEAIDLYHKTGQHLGIFQNSDDADTYANALHDAQAKFYANPTADGTTAILNATTQNSNADVLDNGVFVQTGDGIGLRDPYTGQFVPGADGKTPLSIPLQKILDMGKSVSANTAGDGGLPAGGPLIINVDKPNVQSFQDRFSGIPGLVKLPKGLSH